MPAATSQAHCRRCGHATNQTASAPFERASTVTDDGSGYEIHFNETSVMLQCQVCKTTQLRVHNWNSENGDCDDVYFPPHPIHKAPIWLPELPTQYRQIAEEIYPALDAGCFGAALMAGRALLDVFISTQTSVTRDFGRKLVDLVTQGILRPDQIPILQVAFEAGSAAAHRGFKPSQEDVLTALRIVEDALYQDLLRTKAVALKAATPPRHRS